jgi:hypothetical protein
MLIFEVKAFQLRYRCGLITPSKSKSVERACREHTFKQPDIKQASSYSADRLQLISLSPSLSSFPSLPPLPLLSLS